MRARSLNDSLFRCLAGPGRSIGALLLLTLAPACGGSRSAAGAAVGSGGTLVDVEDAGDANGGSATGTEAGTESDAGGLSAAGAAGAAAAHGDGKPPPDDDPLPACKRNVPIADSPALRVALPAAQPGDCLVLADGDYQFLSIIEHGEIGAPIVIKAENPGKVTASTGLLIFEGASYVAIQGLTWKSTGNVQVRNSDHCRITRCRFQLQEAPSEDWIAVTGTSSYIRIDYNDIGPKHVIGNLVMLNGEGSQVVQHSRIDHNYFHDVVYTTGNGWESIRAGLSQLALSSGFTTIEHNLFEHCGGDPETISIKSSDNIVRYNTILESAGELTLRHGNRNSVYGNYILGHGLVGTSGVRVCGQDHRIYDNYIQGVSGAGISLEGGDSDAMGEAGTAHYRVYRAQVAYNTLVNSSGIQIGGSHPFSPVDCVVANNIVQATTGQMMTESGGPVNTGYLGNIVNSQGNGSVGLSKPVDQILVLDPQLVANGSLFSISATSPAIDHGQGSFDYVDEDVEGRPRSKPDVGAQEFSAMDGPYRPLTPNDVGPDAP
jgi:chondroitinase B-like protein